MSVKCLQHVARNIYITSKRSKIYHNETDYKNNCKGLRRSRRRRGLLALSDFNNAIGRQRRNTFVIN